jgi:hypothetical protein
MSNMRELHGTSADKLRKQVSTLAKFGGEALRSGSIGDLLQRATQLVSEAIEVDLVKVLQLLPDGQKFLVRAGANWRPGVVGHATIPAHGGSAAGFALQSAKPVLSEDIAAEKRFRHPDLLFEHNVRSTVNVLIRGDAQSLAFWRWTRGSSVDLDRTTSTFSRITPTYLPRPLIVSRPNSI